MAYLTDNWNPESFYYDFEEPYNSDEYYEYYESAELPDDVILDEVTTLEGAQDAIRHIKPVSLK